MNYPKKVGIVEQIICGTLYATYDNQLYKLVSPTRDQRALANMIYYEALNDNKFEDLITRDRAKVLLQLQGVWTAQDDIQLKGFEKSLDDLKVRLYKTLYNKKEQGRITKSIQRIEKVINKAMNKKYSLDHFTLEFFAEESRDNFLTAICIKDQNDQYVYSYNNFNRSNKILLDLFLGLKHKKYLSSKQYREIARTEPFRQLWSIGKETLFQISAGDLNLDQRNLILYSKMYDNVYENPERPSEEVINNDYMLDGWFIVQNRKAEIERKQQEVDTLLNKKGTGKHNDAGELFVVADSPEEANKIRELNDLNTSMKLKQRKAALEASGKLNEQELPDVKVDLRNQGMRDMVNKSKGR